jgi:hypothetical protein
MARFYHGRLLAFVSVLLAGGIGRGERILSPATVALMVMDRLTPSL